MRALQRAISFLNLHTIRQLVRYGASGIAAVIVDYGSFAILIGVVKAQLLIATVASLLAGFAVSFLLNRLWVFGARSQDAHKNTRLQLMLYSLLFGVNTVITYLVIYSAHTRFGISEYVAKLGCIAVIMCWNFVL